jgi:hypothetical protein
VFLYPDDLAAFLERGGVLAAGIVPTSDDATLLVVQELTDRLLRRLPELSPAMDAEQAGRQLLITPACGLGTCHAEFAIAAVRTAAAVSRRVRDALGFRD